MYYDFLNNPKKLNPQQKRILHALINNKNGITVQFINLSQPEGLGITQHGARILELRRKGFEIRNDRDCHFYLHTEPIQEILI
jgi:hypothetical protein